MADIEDLAAFVAEHPDDTDQRWRLAKKLYMAWKYDQALEHLLILREQWPDKLNVVRYLAATHYRLGQLDDAINVLKAAVDLWPGEVPLREQLARVYEVSGRLREAVELWKTVQRLEPEYPHVDSAIRRLTTMTADDGDGGGKGRSVNALNASPGKICPQCNAHNSAEFGRCWQCHALLTASGAGAGAPVPYRQAKYLGTTTVTIVGSIFIIGLAAAAAYFTWQSFTQLMAAGSESMTSKTVALVLEQHLLPLRLSVLGALIILWPLTLWLSVRLLRKGPTPAANINTVAMLLPLMTFAALWTPFAMLAIALLLPLVISFALIVTTFGLSFARASLIWLVQAFVVTGALAGCVALTSGLGIVTDYTVINEYALHHDSQPGAGQRTVGIIEAPGSQTIRWASTGSAWLDKAGAEVALLYYAAPELAPLTATLDDGSASPPSTRIQEVPGYGIYTIVPGQTYELRVVTQTSGPVTVVAQGILAAAEE